MKSLHKIILFALLPLMGACSGMLDIEPHSAVSPTVVGSDDIEALRIGMYNKVQEGPTYYSYIAFDLFGGELMTSTGRPIDLINSLSNALHTFVSSQWNGYYKALLQVNNVMSIAEGLADSPTRNRVLGECRYFRAYIYLCLVTRFGDVPVLRQNGVQNRFALEHGLRKRGKRSRFNGERARKADGKLVFAAQGHGLTGGVELIQKGHDTPRIL